MDSLIRQRLGRAAPEPAAAPDPAATWGTGDGGATGVCDDDRGEGHRMDALIRARLDWRRFEMRGRRG